MNNLKSHKTASRSNNKSAERSKNHLTEAMKHSESKRVCDYLDDNPDLFDWLVERCRDIKKKGGRKVGMQWLIERARWESRLDIDPGGSPLKINNSHGPVIARLIGHLHPELEDLFEYRVLGSMNAA